MIVFFLKLSSSIKKYNPKNEQTEKKRKKSSCWLFNCISKYLRSKRKEKLIPTLFVDILGQVT